MQKFLGALVTVGLLLSLTPVQAEDYLTLGAGWFDFNRNDDTAVNFSGEWRGNKFFYDLRPVLGVQANTDGGIYGYGGFDYDWQFAPHWSIIPNLDIGAWSRGSSIDLGGAFEFHEAIELDYTFDNNYRAGVEVAHTSNAGIYSTNPGANQLMATFSIPLGNLPF